MTFLRKIYYIIYLLFDWSSSNQSLQPDLYFSLIWVVDNLCCPFLSSRKTKITHPFGLSFSLFGPFQFRSFSNMGFFLHPIRFAFPQILLLIYENITFKLYNLKVIWISFLHPIRFAFPKILLLIYEKITSKL